MAYKRMRFHQYDLLLGFIAGVVLVLELVAH